ATQAQLDQPIGVAVDTTSGSSAGAAYIADSLNNRVRKVSAAGTITTFAGTGQPGSSGDLGPAASAQLNDPSGVAVDPSGNVYIADTLSNAIRRVDLTSQTITTFEKSSLNPQSASNNGNIKHPWAVAVDGKNNVYWTDTEFHQVASRPLQQGAPTPPGGTR